MTRPTDAPRSGRILDVLAHLIVGLATLAVLAGAVYLLSTIWEFVLIGWGALLAVALVIWALDRCLP